MIRKQFSGPLSSDLECGGLTPLFLARLDATATGGAESGVGVPHSKYAPPHAGLTTAHRLTS